MTAPLACWRCEEPGHAAAECTRPAARTRAELAARIDRLVRRWDAGRGEISTAQKTEYVAAEVRAFEKGRAK